MHPTGRDQLPTAQQSDHLVFELLDPIHHLDDGARQTLLARARHFRLGPRERLDPAVVTGLMLYLVQGQVTRAIPGLGRVRIDELHRGSAEPLIPDGIPRSAAAAARIDAVIDCEIIGFERALVQHLMDEHRHAGSSQELVVKGSEAILFQRLMDDFHSDSLPFPRLPNLAEATLQRLNEHPDDVARLIRLIEGDPALAVRLTHAARASRIAAAVTALGPAQVRGLLISHTLEQACQVRSPLVRERMHCNHRHSLQVAAHSHVIAGINAGLDADKALLCGLLHDIGAFAVLMRADELMDRIGNGLALDAVTRRLHGMIGALMLGRWGYDNDVVSCTEAADDWRRDPAPTADYADVVLVAQLHSFIGSSRAHWLPQFATIPAFKKVIPGDSSPKLSLWLLNQGRQRIAEIARLLGEDGSAPEVAGFQAASPTTPTPATAPRCA